jgi:predicted transcriptional regulator
MTDADPPGADPIGEFVERTAGDLAAQGFPRMPAYVLMTLTATDAGRLTAAELGERIGVSAAAISGAVRYLIQLGFVRSSTQPGTRKHVYALSEGPWYTYSLSHPDMYLRAEVLLRGGAKQMVPGSPARERIEEMAEFYSFLAERMPLLLAEWRERRDGSA